jgi:hypothetical protein
MTFHGNIEIWSLNIGLIDMNIYAVDFSINITEARREKNEDNIHIHVLHISFHNV